LRIKISFSALSKKGFMLPRHHNYLVQAFIYRNLSRHIARFVHDRGYRYEKRRFRLFTFSRIYGKFIQQEDMIVYPAKCSLWIASPITEILESFAASLARKGKFKLGSNFCSVDSIEVPFSEKYGEEIIIRVLSPITVYSTLLTRDNKKKTYYYSPFEPDFSRLIKENLFKKYALLNHGETEEKLIFSIEPKKVSKRNLHIIFYKKTVIKAWSGIYILRGSASLIRIAFDCGLGAKNSQGFGMIEKYG